MARIEVVVAKASPAIYAAAKMGSVTQDQANAMGQWAFTVEKAKELRAMEPDKAKQKFATLSKDAQQLLRSLYPNATYAKEDPSVFSRALGLAGDAVNLLASPIIMTYKGAQIYGKALNLPYNLKRESDEGQNIFSRKIFSEAWQGREIYDNEALVATEKVHGEMNVRVAKGILAGKTPGEIIEEYGKPDAKILSAITNAFDNEDSFKQILHDTEASKVSPGRDLYRNLYASNQAKSGNLTSRVLTGRYHTAVTGTIDALYQLSIDPLTWITGGTSKLATKGARLAETITNGAKNDNFRGAIKDVFNDTDVKALWDDGVGPAIKKFANAPKGTIARSDNFRELVQNYPGFNNHKIVKLLSKYEVFNATAARNFFGEIENVNLLLNGRVDGITFVRNGIPTAQSERHISMGIGKVADAILNPSAGNKKTANDIALRQSKGESAVNILKVAGEEIDNGVNLTGIATFTDIDKDIKRARRFAEIIGKQASRNPAGTQILLGEDAVKTAENFRLVARQVFNRDVADFVTFHFLDSEADEQVIIIRNLYAAVMHRHGLHGTLEGRKFMEETLNKTFNNLHGMTAVSRTMVPKEFADELSPHVTRMDGDIPVLAARGNIHASQVAEGIGSLPYEMILQIAAGTRKKDSIPALFDGATRNHYVSSFVNFWTILTLFPRLGIRSAIDEAMMYALNTPLTDLLSLGRFREVQKFKDVTTALTGSKAAVGPVKHAINKVFHHGGAEEKLSVAERQQIQQDLATKANVPLSEITHLAVRQETVRRVYSMYGVDETVGKYKWLKEAFTHHPDTLNSMASSVAARTSLSGSFDKELIDSIFTPSMLSKALDEIGIRSGRKFRSISAEALKRTNNKYLTLAHYDSFFRQFSANKYTLKSGSKVGEASGTVDAASVFFEHNGLKTPKDFSLARNDMLKTLGIEYNSTTKQFIIKKPTMVKEFLSLFGDSVHARQRGIPEAEIARGHVETMLWDLRTIFHGGPTGFNQDLFSLVGKYYDELLMHEKKIDKVIPGKWSQVAGRISFEEFEKATVKYQPTGEINTSLMFEEFIEKADLESAWTKWGNGLMEQMDRQVNGLFRQPAILATYSRLRDEYEPLQNLLARELEDKMLEETPELSLAVAKRRAETAASKRYTELAMTEAADTILKYADNPAIRSNFALSTRTVARFYRATEDFWRRYYRLMRDKPLQVIYRMRLVHQGLSASGAIHEDESGNQYVVFPTDTIINTAVEPVVRKLTGGAFKVPEFSQITLKLRLINPSFSPEAGQPSLSGPIAAMSFLGIKGMLGFIPGTVGDKAVKFANDYDSWALGDLGDNMTLRKALMPLFLQNLETIGRGVTARAIDIDEMNRQEVTAAFQAISYIKAFGDDSIQLPDNPTDKEKREYLKTVKIAAHNILAVRAFLGMISPISPTLKEGKGVPDYIKSTGVGSLRSEFFDILDGISAVEGDWLADPYELAVATFVGKNPRKIVYTESRNDKETKITIQKTKEMYNWSSTNKAFIDTYGESAYIFGPQTGEYTADSYTWLEAQGLIKQPSLESYLDRVSISVAKNAYFDIARQETEALRTAYDPGNRKGIIANATAARAALKSGYPLLAKALDTGGFEVATEKEILSSMENAISDSSTPISKETRKNMGVLTALVREFISFSEDSESRTFYNFTELKRERKTRIEEILNDLSKSSPAIREASRAVFRPILGFYSRDTYSAEVG